MFRKFSIYFLAALLQACIIPAVSAQSNASLSGYRLAVGDVISITVFGEADLSIDEARLNDVGSVNYPFLGIMKLSGMTTVEVERHIETGLKDGYLVNPQVTVVVKGYREFFINGQVKAPGSYSYQPGLTIEKAATLAGGFTERASRSKIYIVRENDKTGERKNVTLNTPVRPGDSITVDESFF